jgi:hypothetical protein
MTMNPTSTQVQHPWRTTLRTIVWLLIGLAPTIPTLWAIVQDEMTKAGIVIPENIAASIAVGVGVIVAVVGIVQRIVLIPGVAAIIAKIPGLSPTPPVEPKYAIVEPSTTANADGTVTSQASDGTSTTVLGE